MRKLALAAAVASILATPAYAGEVVGTPDPNHGPLTSFRIFIMQMQEDWEALKREAPQSYYTDESYEVEGPSNDRGRVGTPHWNVVWRDIPDNVGVDRGDNGGSGAGASGGGAGSNGGSDSGGSGGSDGGEGPGGDCPGGPGNGNGNSPNSGNGGGNTNGSGPGTGNNGANNGRGNGAGGGGGGSGNGGR